MEKVPHGPLKRLKVNNFGVLPSDTFEFASGINVFVGENGSGKSQVIKLLYSLLKTQYSIDEAISKDALEKAIAGKLIRVFRPEKLGRLVQRTHGRNRSDVTLEVGTRKNKLSFGFANTSSSNVQLDATPAHFNSTAPVFLPTRELATLAPWFVSLYDHFNVEFEETWYDTVSLLGAPTMRGPRDARVATLITPLERALQGHVEVDNNTGRFYVRMPGRGRLEIALVAEGLRKIAMLARLITSGTLFEQGYLFWDEPEANLNPRLIKIIAKTIIHLAQFGIQVFIATHSLFLLRELELLADTSEFSDVPARYFSLVLGPEGTVLEQANDLNEIDTIVSLDESVDQSLRAMGSGEED